MRLVFLLQLDFLVCLSVGECNFCGDGLLKGSDQTTETSSFPELACLSIVFYLIFELVLHTIGIAQ